MGQMCQTCTHQRGGFLWSPASRTSVPLGCLKGTGLALLPFSSYSLSKTWLELKFLEQYLDPVLAEGNQRLPETHTITQSTWARAGGSDETLSQLLHPAATINP